MVTMTNEELEDLLADARDELSPGTVIGARWHIRGYLEACRCASAFRHDASLK